MSLPSGGTPGLPHLAVGPYAADDSQLLKEALDAVCARPEIAEQMSVLQEPPDLEGVVDEHRDVIRLNIADQLERARQLGNRLDGLLVAEMASDPGRLAVFTKLSEAADGLRDVADALAEVTRGSPSGQKATPDGVRELLTAAWNRRSAAMELLVESASAWSIDRLRTAGPKHQTRKPKHQPRAPDWRDPLDGAARVEWTRVHIELARVEMRMVEQLRKQYARASERAEFRNLETEWQSARADLGSAVESTIHGLVLTALNGAVAAQFAFRMCVRSLDGLRETITKERTVFTSSFERLESMIDRRRRGEGSFGISGPRGVGKSTLIKFFTTAGAGAAGPGGHLSRSLGPPAHERLSLEVSAPVTYEPRDFLLHLHAEVCRALLGPNADRDVEIDAHANPRYMARVVTALCVALAGAACVAAGATLIALASRRLSTPEGWWTYAGLVMTCAAAVVLVLILVKSVQVAVPNRLRDAPGRPPSDRVFAEHRRASRMASLTGGWCVSLALCAAVGLPLLTVSGGVGPGTWMLLGGAAAVVIGSTLLLAGRDMARISRDFWRLSRHAGAADAPTYSTGAGIRELAADQLRRIGYQQTLSSERSLTLKVGGVRPSPLGVDVGAKQGTTLAERAKTFPEIVAGLRGFLKTVTDQYEVVIAVDELDKLRSAESVEGFLNDIKAVFGVSGCFFLVSVSEEAAASFERRGMPFRDVFDSCFDDILTLERLGLPAARKILWGMLLGWTEPFVALCYVLSGGLPRELQRSARELVGQREEKSDIDLVPAVPDLMRREAVARLGAVRHSLLRDARDPVGLLLLGRIELIDPGPATAEEFYQWYEELGSWCLRQFKDLARPGGSPQLSTATRLGCELAAYMLFTATVIEFFGSSLDATRLKEAEAINAGNASLAKLADARHALSLSPWTSVSCLVSFRRAWGMRV